MNGGVWWKATIRRGKAGTTKLERARAARDRTDLIKRVYEENSGLDGCPECDERFGRV